MKTQECTKDWKSYLTSSVLFLVILVILVIFKFIFAVQREVSNQSDLVAEKNLVLKLNDEVILDTPLETDTVNIYLNNYHKDHKVVTSLRFTLEPDGGGTTRTIGFKDSATVLDSTYLDTLKHKEIK